MNPGCEHMFSREYMTKYLKKSFVTGAYKSHRENMLYQEELSKFPDSQRFVKNRVALGKLQTQVDAHNTEINLQKEAIHAQRKKLNELMLTKYQLSTTLHLLQNSQYTNEHAYRDIDRSNRIIPAPRALSEVAPTPQGYTYIRKCAFNDCEGFINNRWVCGLCDRTTCKKCHAGEELGHECNPDDVASAKLIQADSRPCPSCTAVIFRISGCPAMFCTECKTCFDWNTGRINESNSNPHYVMWAQAGNMTAQAAARTAIDRTPVNCEMETMRELTSRLYRNIIQRTFDVRYARYTQLTGLPFLDILRSYDAKLVHIVERIIPPAPNPATKEVDLLGLRVDLLAKHIDVATFKQRIQRLDKKESKQADLFNIFTFMVNTVTDIARRSVAITPLTEDGYRTIPPEFTTSITHLLEYVNASLLNISQVYGSVAYTVSDELDVTTVAKVNVKNLGRSKDSDGGQEVP